MRQLINVANSQLASRMNTITNRKRPYGTIGLQLLTVVLMYLGIVGWAKADPSAEYQQALDTARLHNPGDLIVIGGVEVIAERAYRPMHPDLAGFADQYGPGVRFVRLPGMGDKEYEKFVEDFITLFDESARHSPDYEFTLRGLSNGQEKINYNVFLFGDRTVHAVVPERGSVPPGVRAEVGMAGMDALYADKASDYGGRRSIEIGNSKKGTLNGLAAPTFMRYKQKALEEFVNAKRELEKLQKKLGLERFEDFYTKDYSFYLQRNDLGEKVFNRHVGKLFEQYHAGLVTAVHEGGHAANYYKGLTFNIRLKSNGDPALMRLMSYLEELENLGLVPVKGRQFTERRYIRDFREKGGLGEGYYRMRLRTKYRGKNAIQILAYLKGFKHIDGWPEVTASHARIMREVIQAWEASLLELLKEKGYDRLAAEAFLYERWGVKADQSGC